MNKDTVIKVYNRNNGTTGYVIPDLNINRNFQPDEVKSITFEELEKLSFIPGGRYIIENFLYIDNQEAVQELIGQVEPEYFYTDEHINKLLQSGTVDQLADTLNFAPQGVVEKLKEAAVETQLNDISKRKLIAEETGFDVTKAIEIKEAAEENKVEEKSGRKATPVSVEQKASEKTARKSMPVYNVV